MSDSIKFTHGENGQIESFVGNTTLSDIWLLAGLKTTANYSSVAGYEQGLQYPTDEEGLKVAIDKSYELISTLADASKAIATILTHVDPAEIPHELTSALWLIAGLSELSGDLLVSQGDMQYSLEQQRLLEAKKSPNQLNN